MQTENVKKLIDICQEAGQLAEYFPSLPEGITPRCIRVIEQIAILSKEKEAVNVSSISEMLDVTRPGITAVLRNLESGGYVKKQRDRSDNRVVYVSLTPSGALLYQKYVEEYHAHLGEVLGEISDEEALHVHSLLSRVLTLVRNDAEQTRKS